MKLKDRIAKRVVGLLGLVFFGVCVYSLGKRLDLMKNSETYRGCVVDNKLRRSSYHPVVEYVDKDGNKKIFTSGGASKPPSYSIGDSVTIMVHKKNDMKAEINTFANIWLGPILAGVLGLIFILIGFMPPSGENAFLRNAHIPPGS
jgi:hypothetical protein